MAIGKFHRTPLPSPHFRIIRKIELAFAAAVGDMYIDTTYEDADLPKVEHIVEENYARLSLRHTFSALHAESRHVINFAFDVDVYEESPQLDFLIEKAYGETRRTIENINQKGVDA